jgi:hypothetical protein
VARQEFRLTGVYTDPAECPSMGRAWKHTDGGNLVEDIGEVRHGG